MSIKLEKDPKIEKHINLKRKYGALDTSDGNIIPNLFSIFREFFEWDRMPIHTLRNLF